MKKKYLSEEVLIEKMQKSEIGWLEYVTSFSKEWDEEFATFIEESGLEASDESAERFLVHKKEEMEQGFGAGDI